MPPDSAAPLGWWVLSGDTLIDLLRRAHDGDDPDMLYAEHYANSQNNALSGDTPVVKSLAGGKAEIDVEVIDRAIVQGQNVLQEHGYDVHAAAVGEALGVAVGLVTENLRFRDA